MAINELSIEVLFSFTPIYILIIGFFLVYFLNDRTYRKSFSALILLLALVMNSIVLFGFYIPYNLIIRDYNLNLTVGTYILIEMILLLSMISFIFAKHEIVNIKNENMMDGLLFLLILSLIGTIISSNLLAIFSCFFVVIIIIGVVFYFGNYPKEFRLLKMYFLAAGLSTLLLFIASIAIYVEFNTLIITEIKLIEPSKLVNFFITTLILLGIGIPCGLFPFSIYHLKNYYQDSSYTSLSMFSTFISVNIFLILRILNAFSYLLQINGVIVMILSSIGLIISMIFVLRELIASIDGGTYSIKKLYGYSLCSDYNLFLLFASYLVIVIGLDLTALYLNFLIFFVFFTIAIKALIFSTYYPVMLETYDDNLKLLGEFNKKYKKFGLTLGSSGLLISLPMSIFTLYIFFSIAGSESILNNSLYSTISSLLIGFYLIYIIISLTGISVSYIEMYFSNKPRYVERESIKSITKYDYAPIIIIFVLIGILATVFLLGNDLFYSLFKSYLMDFK